MSSSDKKHQNVCRFILNLCGEKDGSTWEQIDKLSEIDYEASMSILVRTAESHGYSFVKEDWEWAVKKIIEAHPDQQDNENCDVIECLKKPTKEHSDSLKEYVYEICDYEGDPDWDKEEDYRFRVEHVIATLQEQIEDESAPLLLACTQEQLEGKGWVPNRFGISCCTGHSWTTIKWSDVADAIAVLLEKK